MNANHIRILQAAMRGIMLRRGKESKLDGKPIITLPKRIINFDAGPFTAPEQDFYDALEKKSMIKFNHFLAAGTVVQNYTNILVLLMRLRQACDHPNLIPESVAIAGNGVEVPVIADGKARSSKACIYRSNTTGRQKRVHRKARSGRYQTSQRDCCSSREPSRVPHLP